MAVLWNSIICGRCYMCNFKFYIVSENSEKQTKK